MPTGLTLRAHHVNSDVILPPHLTLVIFLKCSSYVPQNFQPMPNNRANVFLSKISQGVPVSSLPLTGTGNMRYDAEVLVTVRCLISNQFIGILC